MIRCGCPAKNRWSRELTARGLQAVATYRMAPKEELQSAERARGWFEKASVEGVVALRPVSSEKRISLQRQPVDEPLLQHLLGLLRLRL